MVFLISYIYKFLYSQPTAEEEAQGVEEAEDHLELRRRLVESLNASVGQVVFGLNHRPHVAQGQGQRQHDRQQRPRLPQQVGCSKSV